MVGFSFIWDAAKIEKSLYNLVFFAIQPTFFCVQRLQAAIQRKFAYSGGLIFGLDTTDGPC